MWRELERHKEAHSLRVAWRGGRMTCPTFMCVDKNEERHHEVRDPSPKPDHPAGQGSSTRKINPQTSGCKIQRGLGQWKKLPDSQETPIKGPHGLRTYADPAPLGFTTRATVGRALVTYGEKVK